MYYRTASELLSFISSSPSPFHAVQNICAMLHGAGFHFLSEADEWRLAPGKSYYTTRNGSSVIAFRIPEKPENKGYMIAAAHSDSPTFRIKECAELKDRNYVRLNVEGYGGMLLTPWLDRPLSAAGRLILRDGSGIRTKLVNADRNLLLIPNVAIHMNREANNGQKLNPQVDLLPLFSQSGSDITLRSVMAEAANISPDSILDADLLLYVREPGRIWGAANEFISSPKLDDLECAYCLTRGLIEAPAGKAISVAAVFDNEEVGSLTKQGADSTFLHDVLTRIADGLGRSRADYLRSLTKSFMVSADNAHAVHPNHPEKTDVENYPKMNGGIVIKYSANQKYTTDALSASLFQLICENAGVPTQVFLNRSDQPGGSTLGNISTAHVSINSVDIGLAQLAMHSPYETAGVKDPQYLLTAMCTYFAAAMQTDGAGGYSFEV